MIGYRPGKYSKRLRRRDVFYGGRKYTITKNRDGQYLTVVFPCGLDAPCVGELGQARRKNWNDGSIMLGNM